METILLCIGGILFGVGVLQVTSGKTKKDILKWSVVMLAGAGILYFLI